MFVLFPNLFLQRFQLRNYFEILWSAGGTFHPNEPRQVEQLYLTTADGDGECVGEQILIVTAAGDFAQQVDGTDGGGEREVESRAQGGDRPVEARSRGRSR